MLDVHRLRVFRSVVASGSIQSAAANLGYTPSAVSQQVSTLQRETGLTLVARVGRGIEATAAGRALAERVDAILAHLGDIDGFVGDLRAGRSGVLSLSYFASVGAAWMPRLIADLEVEFPDVRLDLHLREHFDSSDGLVDVQIAVERPDFVAPSGFVAHRLLDDPYVAALPPGHPLAGVASIDLADLRQERWIDNDVARGWCHQVVIEACHSAGFAPPFRLQAHDYRTALAFVAGGLGLTVLPRLGTRDLPAGVRAVPIVAPTPVRSIYAVASTATCDTPASVRAIALLRECAAGGSDQKTGLPPVTPTTVPET